MSIEDDIEEGAYERGFEACKEEMIKEIEKHREFEVSNGKVLKNRFWIHLTDRQWGRIKKKV